MRYLFKILIPLLFSVSAFGQSGINVKVTNPDNISKSQSKFTSIGVNRKEIIKREGRGAGGDFTAYSGTPANGTDLVAVSRISDIGGQNVYLDYITVVSSVDCQVRINIKGQNGLVDFLPYTQPRHLQAGKPEIISIDQELEWAASIFITWIGTTAGSTITFKSGWGGFYYSQSKKQTATGVMLFLGDSIAYGANSTLDENNPYKSWANYVYLHYFNRGFDVKPVNKSVPGITAENMLIAVTSSWADIDNVVISFVALGTNTSPSRESYIASIKGIVDQLIVRYPGKPVMIMNPIKRIDSGGAPEAALVNYRTDITSLVATYNNPLIKQITTELAYDPTVHPEYGVVSGEVHPNDAGHLANGAYIISELESKNVVPLFYIEWHFLLFMILIYIKRRKDSIAY